MRHIQGRAWLPPARGLERARWYYLAFFVAVSASCVPATLFGTGVSGGWKMLGLVGLVVLLAVRVREYRQGRLLGGWLELPQAVVLAVSATAAGPLDAGLGVFFAGCFFRALYASAHRTALTTFGAVGLLGVCAAIGTADWERTFASQAFGIVVATLLTRMLLGTLLQQNEDVLRNERLLQTVFDNLDVSVMIGYGAAAPVVMNRAAQAMNTELGLPPPPAPWHTTVEVYASDGVTPLRPEDMPAAQALRGDRVRDMEMVLGLSDGSRRHFTANAAQICLPGNDPGVVVTISDVTSRVEAEATMAHMALHDPLTGLGNRRLLSKTMVRWLALDDSGPGGGFAVLLLDLDGFKRINDSLGHARGDEVLGVIAGRLRSCVRPDDVVVRLGGDEFAVLVGLPGSAADLADRICAAVREPVELALSRIILSTSIGIAYLDHRDSPGQALAAADLAMYAAKAAGPGQAREFQPDMMATLHKRVELEADLQKALQLDEFELHYQPYVNLETGDVVGAEALVRWRSPSRGLVLPLDFIPLVEDNGMIVPLGRWILQTACRAAAAWQPSDPGRLFTVSVNVSGRQLDEPDFVDDVARALHDSGLAPGALTVEVTESVFLTDTDALRNCLRNLKALGVRIAVDDFGTGYSSLSRLQTFPVDVLKIDRSFVNAIGSDTGGALVRAVIALADALVLEVVAEGVESQAEAHALLRQGCRVAQGYYFGRPAPAPPHGLRRPSRQGSGTDDARGDSPNVGSARRS